MMMVMMMLIPLQPLPIDIIIHTHTHWFIFQNWKSPLDKAFCIGWPGIIITIILSNIYYLHGLKHTYTHTGSLQMLNLPVDLILSSANISHTHTILKQQKTSVFQCNGRYIFSFMKNTTIAISNMILTSIASWSVVKIFFRWRRSGGGDDDDNGGIQMPLSFEWMATDSHTGTPLHSQNTPHALITTIHNNVSDKVMA